jgi:lysophospholipase L1-like esterase
MPLPIKLAVLAALVAGLVAAPATARPAPVTPGSAYLALGDSVTFGYQEPAVVPAPRYARASSFVGYPEQLGAVLRLKVANAACPGETSSSFIDPSAQSFGCENVVGPGGTKRPGGYRTLFPLHVRYRGSQLRYAVAFLRAHRNVRLVSLMIGANDLFACQQTTSDACASPAEQQAVLTRLAANVRRILSAIRTRAHYRGQLAIVTYYSLDYASPGQNRVVRALNRTLKTAAQPFSIVVARGFPLLRAAGLRSGSNSCTAGLLTQLGRPGACGVHPSFAGQALLAQALGEAVRT